MKKMIEFALEECKKALNLDEKTQHATVSTI